MKNEKVFRNDLLSYLEDELNKSINKEEYEKAGEISKAAVFLVSDDNSYITGQHIVVDGGFTNV